MTKGYSLLNRLIILSALFSVLLTSCSKKPEAKREIPVPSVYVKKVVVQDAPVYYETFGYLTQKFNVDIRSQVTGKILSSHFKEGDFVKKGDLLFMIDPSEYQADLDKAKAALAESEAELKLKNMIVELDKKIADSGALAAQTYAKYQTEAAVVEARILLNKAQIELCQINLDYCRIVSPVDGITGKQLVDPGNVIMANAGPALVNIKTIDPLYVDFNIPDKYLAELRECMKKGKPVVELTPDQAHVQQKTYSAELDFLDNSVNNNTGTILLRATIENKDRELWPGQYVRIKLIFFVKKDATLVPADAVMKGKDGSYVYVIKNGKAEYKIINATLRQGDYVMIDDGALNAGDDVVTAGQLGISPGATVKILDGSKENPSIPESESSSGKTN